MNILLICIILVLTANVYCIILNCDEWKEKVCYSHEKFDEGSRITSVKDFELKTDYFEDLGIRNTKFVPLDLCKHFTALSYFWIDGEQIKKISSETFQGCFSVRDLSILFTLIEVIPENIFFDMRSLENLQIGGKLKILPEKLISMNKNLKEFYASDNRLEIIEIKFSEEMLAVDLSGNKCINIYGGMKYKDRGGIYENHDVSIRAINNEVSTKCFNKNFNHKKEEKSAKKSVSLSYNFIRVRLDEKVKVTCDVKGFFNANISWSFQKCYDSDLWPYCRSSENVITSANKLV
jgi:hypothetical protein